MVRKIGFCQKAEPCCWPGLKNEKNGEMTAKLGGVTTGAEIHHFEPAVNSNSFSPSGDHGGFPEAGNSCSKHHYGTKIWGEM